MERWKKSVVAGYEVSSLGGIRRKGKALKPMRKPDGYLYIQAKVNGTRKNMYVHRLVALAFCKNPCRYPVVNHINGDKADNRAANLEWMTQSENLKHAYRIGLAVITERHRETATRTILTLTPAQRETRRRRWHEWWNGLGAEEQTRRMSVAAAARRGAKA